MSNPRSAATSLFDRFLQIARSEESQDLDALECDEEICTYAELDIISTALAEDIRRSYGERPIVAIVSENHPYVFATILATWKIGGIVAPIDCHTPKEILAAMLLDIKPTCALVPGPEVLTRRIVTDLSIPLLPFEPKASTILVLAQKYVDRSPGETHLSHLYPSHEDIGIYLHTSSASNISNIKCVPLTHANILAGASARLTWWQKTWPNKDFKTLKVLGWSPWSHIIGVSHDLGAAMLLTGGCYIFAVRPSCYHTVPRLSHEASLDVISQLLETAIRKSTTAFAGVPWILEGIMAKWDAGFKDMVERAMANFQIFGLGGAAPSSECLNWSKEHAIPIVIDIGMTELGGPLFHNTFGDAGWSISECLVTDSELSLVDENGERTLDEGELHISSSSISRGYLRPNYSAFTVAPSGRVTLRTGDIYRFVGEGRLVWKGRKEDFIQMNSGETLDPRIIEKSLDRSVAIHRSCVVGDKFLRGASRVVCAILELSPADTRGYHASLAEVTRVIAASNRSLAPPLRISWARVLILNSNQHIPVTRKGAVFRKKLEDEFGSQLESLLFSSGETLLTNPTSVKGQKANQFTEDSVAPFLTDIIASELRLTKEVLTENYAATFAELGMDSSMATKMVNAINNCFGLSLPLNTCHTYVDLNMLTSAIISELGIVPTATSASTTTLAPPTPFSPSCTAEEVVIVGQALRLPGNINKPEEFWDALLEKRDDIIGPIPQDRWDHPSFYRAPNSDREEIAGDITLDKAGFINITDFDHTFFGISSVEAYHVAPNIRLTLEIAFEALENANIPMSTLKGSDMGVFVAANMDEGHIKLLFSEKGWGAYTRFYGTGVATSTACGRLSYLLDIHGPSYTIDTACSSGLVGFDQAVRYLQSGQGESAIVCGANTHSWPGNFGFLSAQKMTSPNSRCATYTDMADGYVPSEGAAAVVLKTKKAAMRDGDQILAVVKSTATMHDGRSQGLVAPNVKAQIKMQRSLLRQGSLDPGQIDFVEAHGTGTSLGDLIEIEGINEVFKSSHSSTRPLIVGAAKTCVGHTETVAGLIGLLKVVGSFSNSAVPGLSHLTANNMNPSLDCGVVPLRIPWQTTPLLRSMVTKEPLRGMVLSNGFAGTIAGAILEEPEACISRFSSEALSDGPSESSQGSSWVKLESDRTTNSSPFTPSRTPSPISSPTILDYIASSQLFVVSAKSPAALTAYVESYVTFCEGTSVDQFESVCYTSCVGREHYRYRFSCVAKNMGDLINKLKQSLLDKRGSPVSILRNIAFAFPGQGSQYQGMARDLSLRFPAFLDTLTSAADQASDITDLPILSYLVDADPPAARSLSDSDVAQICIFVYQYSVSKWLQDLRIPQSTVIGHSLGEIAAAVVAGSLTFKTALEFVIKRASVLRPDITRPAGMAAVAGSPEAVNSYLDTLSLRDRLSIAVYNAEQSIVVSGSLEAIDILVSAVKQEGLKATKLDVDQAFHSPYVVASLPVLRKWLLDHEETLTPLKTSFYSSALGRRIRKGDRLNPDYWINHAQSPVLFLDAAKALTNDGTIDAVLDLGPQPFVWTQFQTDSLSSKASFSVTGKRGKSQSTAFFSCLSQLFEHGVNIDFSKLLSDGPYNGGKISLPTYPFQRIHNYPTYVPSRNRALPTSTPTEEAPLTIRFVIDEILCATLDAHRIDGRRIVPGAAFADFFALSLPSKCLEELRFHQPLVADGPDNTVVGVIECGAFTLLQGTSKICSGKVAQEGPLSAPKWTDDERLPLRIVKNSKVYEYFKNVAFGLSFRNIHEIKLWDDHADAIISVTDTLNPAQDRIRKLDACMHMFGAIVGLTLPDLAALDGVFLPSSLHGFHLHSESLPSTFVARYQLPVDVGRGSQVLSVQMAVFSLTGQLLLSCQKYSVAFIPSGVAVPKVPERQTKWMSNLWVPKALPSLQIDLPKVDELLYLGVDVNPPLLRQFLSTASHTIYVQLPTSPTTTNDSIQIANTFKGIRISVVLDLGSLHPEPGSDTHFAVCQQVLSFLKTLMNSGADIASLLVLTFDSVPVYISEANPPRPTLTFPSVASIINGMLRVFKRETALDSVAWSLDLPSLHHLQDDTAKTIILDELVARNTGKFFDGAVAYRFSDPEHTPTLTRYTPSLQLMETTITQPCFSGVAVIAGIGSIGVALASGLVRSGVESVVFMGRRDPGAQSILDEFSGMDPELRAKSSYHQVDITNKNHLEQSLKVIQVKFGPIRHIIHSAAVMRDAAIPNISPVAFEEVLRPKICGGWNLHLLSEKLALNLDSFVVLSSTNVLVGNPGQLGYVAANSFLDYLACVRHNMGLPGVSIQLGAWESRLTENLNMKKSFALKMTHAQGVPLIMQAMSTRQPVQVVAEFDIPKLQSVPAYAMDYFFAPILPKEESVPSLAPTAAPTSKNDVRASVAAILRSVMELMPSETLDLGSSLTASGGDSITFAQLRGRILKEIGVDIPKTFLGEMYTMGDIVDYAVKGASV